jgi:uncharacterized protein (DUF1800 family)
VRRLSEEEARHLLLRATFGPRPGDVRALTESDLGTWLDEQLGSAPSPPELATALEPYVKVFDPPSKLFVHFPKPESGRDEPGAEEDDPEANMERRLDKAELLRTLQMAELTRHILSKQQLREVMADFWINHFNVQGAKAQIAVTAPSYLEGIRERALGKFEDLLSFTAHHPAMLIYLDNVRSVSLPPKRAQDRPFRGLNENYARELLELHTLGVDGGYTQDDVREAARVLTGWGTREEEPFALSFAFHEARHDREAKRVLGHDIAPAGRAEGEGLLVALARHPATSRHVAAKLCRRFVADDPDTACVDLVAEKFRSSNGDIAVTLRTLLESPSFWVPSVRGQKLKSPLEFVASAVRALGGSPDGSSRLARRLVAMGEGLMRFPAPTGYPERRDAWLSSGALHARMELCTDLMRGAAAGVDSDPVALFAGSANIPRQAEALIVGTASIDTRTAVEQALSRLDEPRQQKLLGLALFLGSPEFQKQ